MKPSKTKTKSARKKNKDTGITATWHLYRSYLEERDRLYETIAALPKKKKRKKAKKGKKTMSEAILTAMQKQNNLFQRPAGAGRMDVNLLWIPDYPVWSFDSHGGKLEIGMDVVVMNGSIYCTGVVSCCHKSNIFLKNVRMVDGSYFKGGNSCNEHKEHYSYELACGNGYRFQIIDTVAKESIKQTSFKPGDDLNVFILREFENTTNKERKKWLHTYQQCVLPKRVKDIVEEAITTVLLAHRFEEWGINEHFEKGLTNAILLYGPPGTGKTMISESIAAVLGKNLLKIDTSAIQSQIPGQAERNIKANFEEAKKKNAVLMLDECDSLLYDRNSVGMIIASEINCLLTEIERFDGVVVLTTNRLGRLDPALQRRIIAKVELELPGKEERVQIWKNLMPPKVPLDDSIDYDKLADAKIAGGDIKNAILLAVRKAVAKNHDKVTMEHFTTALLTVSKAKEDFEGGRPTALKNKYEFQPYAGRDKVMAGG